METHYPKFLLYGLLVLGSWLMSCLLHFHFIHLYLMSSRSHTRSGAALAVLPPRSPPIALNASSLPAPDAVGAPLSAASCEGRYVYMLEVPSRFDVLSRCFEGSSAFQDKGGVCSLMVNAGMGPVLPPATGNGSDGDAGVIPNTGW